MEPITTNDQPHVPSIEVAVEAPVETTAPTDTTTAPDPKPDLAKEQADKVTGVAQGLLEDMATMLMPLDGKTFDLKPLELATLARILAADLKLQTEVPLTFQYTTSGITGLLQILQDCTYHEPHTQADFAEAAREILAILAKAKASLGDTATVAESLASVKAELETRFADKQLSAIDVRYILNSITSTFDTLRNGVEKSIEESMERAQAKAFSVESVQDVSMGKLDSFLKQA